jgi:hypothetical protein
VASFCADENFPLQVVTALRELGHDVLTAPEAGRANQAIPDEAVVEFATAESRAVLTLNRWEFIRLHSRSSTHGGIVVCTVDPDVAGQAARIHEAVEAFESLRGELIRVNRPAG